MILKSDLRCHVLSSTPKNEIPKNYFHPVLSSNQRRNSKRSSPSPYNEPEMKFMNAMITQSFHQMDFMSLIITSSHRQSQMLTEYFYHSWGGIQKVYYRKVICQSQSAILTSNHHQPKRQAWGKTYFVLKKVYIFVHNFHTDQAWCSDSRSVM
jgi:hypothetical protein